MTWYDTQESGTCIDYTEWNNMVDSIYTAKAGGISGNAIWKDGTRELTSNWDTGSYGILSPFVSAQSLSSNTAKIRNITTDLDMSNKNLTGFKDLESDSYRLVWNDSEGRLGFGDDRWDDGKAPSSLLHVREAAGISIPNTLNDGDIVILQHQGLSGDDVYIDFLAGGGAGSYAGLKFFGAGDNDPDAQLYYDYGGSLLKINSDLDMCNKDITDFDTLESDSVQFTYDDTNARLGIGTTSWGEKHPSAQLHLRAGGGNIPPEVVDGSDGHLLIMQNDAVVGRDVWLTMIAGGEASSYAGIKFFGAMDTIPDARLYYDYGDSKLFLSSNSVEVYGDIKATQEISSSTGVYAHFISANNSNLAGEPGGSDGQIQYNNGGSFGGDSKLTWDDTSDRLIISGGSGAPTFVASRRGGALLDKGLYNLYSIASFVSSGDSSDGVVHIVSSKDKNSILKFTDAAGTYGQLIYDSSDDQFEYNFGGGDALTINSDGDLTFAGDLHSTDGKFNWIDSADQLVISGGSGRPTLLVSKQGYNGVDSGYYGPNSVAAFANSGAGENDDTIVHLICWKDGVDSIFFQGADGDRAEITYDHSTDDFIYDAINSHIFKQDGSPIAKLSYSSPWTYIYGSDTSSDDLVLRANTKDSHTYMRLGGSGGAYIFTKSGSNNGLFVGDDYHSQFFKIYADGDDNNTVTHIQGGAGQDDIKIETSTSYIELLYGNNLVYNSPTAHLFKEDDAQIFKISSVAGGSQIVGTSIDAADLTIKATTVNDRPYIELEGAADIIYDSDDTHKFKKDGTEIFKIDYDSNITKLYGGTSTGDDLYIYANELDECSKIQIYGSGSNYYYAGYQHLFYKSSNLSQPILRLDWNNDDRETRIFGSNLHTDKISIYPTYLGFTGENDILFPRITLKGQGNIDNYIGYNDKFVINSQDSDDGIDTSLMFSVNYDGDVLASGNIKAKSYISSATGVYAHFISANATNLPGASLQGSMAGHIDGSGYDYGLNELNFVSSQKISGQLLALHKSRDIQDWDAGKFTNSGLIWKTDHWEAMPSGGSGFAGASEMDDLTDADTTTDPPNLDEYLKWNGSNWVPATADQTFSFAIASFIDNQSNTQLMGAADAQWKAIDTVSFTATYTNGPATSGGVSTGDWTNVLDMGINSNYEGPSSNTEVVNYPSTVGGNVTFTLRASGNGNGTDSDTERVYFYNLIYWGSSQKTNSYNESDIEGMAYSSVSNTKGRTITKTYGTDWYVIYALPERLGTCTFTVDGFSGGFQDPQGGLSITNAAGYTEDYYVYRSTNHSLGEVTIVVT